MIDLTKFDLLSPKFDQLFALNDRIEAMVNPLGEMQQGLAAAMKTQQLSSSMVGTQQWLDSIGATNALAISARMDEAFKALTFPVLAIPNAVNLAPLNIASLVPQLPPGITSLLQNMELAQGSFFKNWTGLAAALEQPGWVKQLEAMQVRFDRLFTEVASETTETAAEELEASVVLSANVFTLGNEVLADPATAASHIKLVLAACAALLTKTLNSKTRVLLQDLIIYLTFIVMVRDNWQKVFPTPPVPNVGEVAIQQEMRENRTQTAMLTFQLARQNGQVQLTQRATVLRARPAGKAPIVGRLPAATELILGARVRTWVQVSGFNDAGEVVQGWLPVAQLPLMPAAPAPKTEKRGKAVKFKGAATPEG